MKTFIKIAALLFTFSISAQQDCTEAILLNTNEFKEEISKKNVQLVDVRTEAEFQEGHIENAMLVDFYQKNTFQEKLNCLDKEQAIYIYCRSGNRSKKAAKLLCQMGFKKVYDLKGGFLAWQ